jgi:large subunit ribosomal protein L4
MLDIQRKVYDLGVKTALSEKFRADRVIIVDYFNQFAGLKAQMRERLQVLGLVGKKVYFMYGQEAPLHLLFLVNQFTKKRSIRGKQEKEHPLMLTSANHVSVTALLEHDYIVMDKEAVEKLEEMYAPRPKQHLVVSAPTEN